MIKVRPVVVVSAKFKRRDGIATVVPLSTTAPRVIEPYHVTLNLKGRLAGRWNEAEQVWVKADMITAVAFERLNLMRTPRNSETGKRQYNEFRITEDELLMVRRAISYSIGIVTVL